MEPVDTLRNEDMASCFNGRSRRKFLSDLAILAGSALFPVSQLAAQEKGPSGNPGWIDVHHHFSPTTYSEFLKQKGILPGPMVGWSLQKSLDDMDRAGVAAAMNSIVVPGVWFGDADQARRLARESNEYAAKLVSDHPKRFGNFASVTLPDIEGSLKEIEYSLDVLKADGIQLWTSYGDKWLGDPFFAPVFEEMNRRKAVIFVHPTENACCTNFPPNFKASIEYGTETTRAIVRMVSTGASKRYPDIRMIFSHAGGTMPFLIGRFVNRVAREGNNPAEQPSDFQTEVGRFYYDTAQSFHPVPMTALQQVVPISRIVFGTDYPYRSSLETTNGLLGSKVFNAEQLRAIKAENALALLPRLKAQIGA